jgi:hypothetical protein
MMVDTAPKEAREPSDSLDPVPNLAGYMSVGDWLDRNAGAFFETRSSLDWFIKRHRRELVESGALIPREGRSGSLVDTEEFPKAVVRILRRRALGKVAA